MPLESLRHQQYAGNHRSPLQPLHNNYDQGYNRGYSVVDDGNPLARTYFNHFDPHTTRERLVNVSANRKSYQSIPLSPHTLVVQPSSADTGTVQATSPGENFTHQQVTQESIDRATRPKDVTVTTGNADNIIQSLPATEINNVTDCKIVFR